jgi:hypothetical protein
MVLSEHQRQLGFEGVPVAGNEFLSTGRPPRVIHPPPCSQTAVLDGYDRLSEPCRPAPSTERGGCTRSSGGAHRRDGGPSQRSLSRER